MLAADWLTPNLTLPNTATRKSGATPGQPTGTAARLRPAPRPCPGRGSRRASRTEPPNEPYQAAPGSCTEPPGESHRAAGRAGTEPAARKSCSFPLAESRRRDGYRREIYKSSIMVNSKQSTAQFDGPGPVIIRSRWRHLPRADYRAVLGIACHLSVYDDRHCVHLRVPPRRRWVIGRSRRPGHGRASSPLASRYRRDLPGRPPEAALP